MNHRGIWITGLLLVSVAASSAADMVLVDREAGVAAALICVPTNAPPRTREAAVTLADYLEKISGVRPAIVDGAPVPPPERAIWVGIQAAVTNLLPEVDVDFKYPEETLLVATEAHLVIAGRDRWDPAHMEAKGRRAMKTGVQQEYGTANAVYTFIEDKLGVRWLWPGEDDVVRQPRIALAPFTLRYHPQMRARAGMFVKLSLGNNKEGPDDLWARYQRVQLDSMPLEGGHGFGDWWERYGKEHPDYFALQPDGTRSPNPFSVRNTKLCESNPKVWQQWLADVDEQLRADPTRCLFNASENDGYDYGHCVCRNCVAKDPPDGEKFTFRWKGKKEQCPALSDRQVQFANTLARLLKERHPDKECFVQLHAYGYSRPAPLAVVPDDNVIIASVGNFHMRSPVERELPMKQFADWAAKATHLMWRPNLGNPAGLTWGMPDVAMTQAGEDFRFVADHHCMGVFFDMFWFHWATQGPHYYALAHLAWNPYVDVKALMDDYYQRCYGPAAAEMKAYWELWERARMEFVAANASRWRAFDIPDKYTPGLLGRAQSQLDAAASKLEGADDGYRRRLHFARCGLEFTTLVVDTRAAMRTFEASKCRDVEAKAHVLANWARAGQMKKEFPAFAINWQSVFRTPGAGEERRNKRTEGLHPDAPISARVLRQLRAAGLE